MTCNRVKLGGNCKDFRYPVIGLIFRKSKVGFLDSFALQSVLTVVTGKISTIRILSPTELWSRNVLSGEHFPPDISKFLLSSNFCSRSDNQFLSICYSTAFLFLYNTWNQKTMCSRKNRTKCLSQLIFEFCGIWLGFPVRTMQLTVDCQCRSSALPFFCWAENDALLWIKIVEWKQTTKYGLSF